MTGLALRPPIDRNASPEQALESLAYHLENSMKCLENEQKCAVLFSGGVDSSLAAIMTKKYCNETVLFTARCTGSHDEKIAVEAAKAMSLEIVEIDIDSNSLWNTLPDIVQAIKTRNRMDVEISIPFFFAAQEIKKHDFNMVISGQGPDELFAGYARYEKLMVEQGPEKVEDALWADFSITDEANIQRDTRVIKHHGLEPFFPFLNQDFARIALSLPATMNIDPKKSPARKLLFRKLAMKLGVPKEVAMTPKRATQYSSGTAKMLTESIRTHVDRLGSLSRKEIQSEIQHVLNDL